MRTAGISGHRCSQAVAAVLLTAGMTTVALGVDAPEAGAAGGTVVSSCTESALDAAVSAGGSITFTCSGTIILSQPLPLTNGESVSIDGGNTVALSGGGLVPIASITGGTVLFENIALINALNSGVTGSAGPNGTDGSPGTGGPGGAGAAVAGGNGSPGSTGTDGMAGTAGTVGQNGTTAKGGALTIAAGSTVTLANVTFSGDVALGGDGGAGGNGGPGGFGGGGGGGGSASCQEAGGVGDAGTVGSYTVSGADAVTATTPSTGGAGGIVECLPNQPFSGDPSPTGTGGAGGPGGAGGLGGAGAPGGQGGSAAGGAIYNAGTLIINDSIFTNNEALAGLGGGGGVGGVGGAGGEGGEGGHSTFSYFPVADGGTTVGGAGGADGISGAGANGGQGGSASGGAIDNEGTLTLTGSTFSGNEADAGGGSPGGAGGVAAPGGGGVPGGPDGGGAATSGTPGAPTAPVAAAVTGNGGAGGSASGGAVYNNATLNLSSTTFSGDKAFGGIGGAGAGPTVGLDGFAGVAAFDWSSFDAGMPGHDVLTQPAVNAAGSSGGAGANGADGGVGGIGGNAQGGALATSGTGSTTVYRLTFSGEAAGGGDGGPGGDGGAGGTGGIGGAGGSSTGLPFLAAGNGGHGGNGGNGGAAGNGGHGGSALGGAIEGNLTQYAAGASTFSGDTVTGGDGGDVGDVGAAGALGGGGDAGTYSTYLSGYQNEPAAATAGAAGTAGTAGASGSDGVKGSESNNNDTFGTVTGAVVPLTTVMATIDSLQWGVVPVAEVVVSAPAPFANPPQNDKVLVQASQGATVKGSCTAMLPGGPSDVASCFLPSTLAVGTYSVSATFEGTGTVGGDAAFASAASTPSTFTVEQSTANVNIGTILSTPVGSPSSFALTVSNGAIGASAGAPPNGDTVAVTAVPSAGGAVAATCTVTLTGGTGTCTMSPNLALGSYLVTATFASDPNFAAASTSATLNVVTPTVTTPLATPSPASFGGAETYSVTVTASGATPTGVVSFTSGQTALCTTGALVSGQGSCTATNAPVGANSIKATYEGGTGVGGSSGTTPLTVNVTAPAVPTVPAGTVGAQSSFSPSFNTTASATVGGLTATGTGVGALTVSKYPGNPTNNAISGGTGTYYDVAVAPGSSFGSLTITQCDLGAGGNSLQWFGFTGWQPFSSQVFNSVTNCVTATLTGSTSPTPAQLIGTPIGGAVVGPSDFELGINPSSQVLTAGSSILYKVSVSSVTGFAGTVTLAVSGLPTGVTSSFVSNVATVVPDGTSEIQLNAASSWPAPGTFTFTVTATSGALSHTITAQAGPGLAVPENCNATVAGTITDASTGLPISGAHVDPFGSALDATTDANGHYTVSDINVGPQTGTTTVAVDVADTGYYAQSVTEPVSCTTPATLNLSLPKVDTSEIKGHVYLGVPDPNVHTVSRAITPDTTHPLVGAEVSFTELGGNQAQYSQATMAGGSYDITGVQLFNDNAPAQYAPVASDNGATNYWPEHLPAVGVADGQAGSADFALVPICTATIDATIINESGAPVVGAQVVFTDSLDNEETLASGPGGLASFTSVPLGDFNASIAYLVGAATSGVNGVSGSSSAQLGDCGDTAHVTIVATPTVVNTGSLDVSVLDAVTGLPVAGANVLGNLTAADGTTAFNNLIIGTNNVVSSSVQLAANAGGYEPYQSPFGVPTIISGQTTHFTIDLNPIESGTVVGTVTDATSGTPIAGVSISSAAGGAQTFTNALGQYRLAPLQLGPNNTPRLIDIGAQDLPNYITQGTTVNITGTTTSTVNFALVRQCGPATVSGVVYNANTGAPLPGATVTGQSGGMAVTDVNGAFSFQIAMEDGNNPFTEDVTASKAGFTTESAPIKLYCGAHIVLDLGNGSTETGALIGTVTAAVGGAPVVGATVNASFGASTTTDASGDYSFNGVPLGSSNAAQTWQVQVVPPAASPLQPAEQSTAVAAAPPSTTLNFALTTTPPPAPVAVADAYAGTENQSLSVPAGTGLLANDSGSQISVTGHTQPEQGGSVTVNPDGSFTLNPNTGETGADVFSYTITDAFGATATASATVTLASSGPPTPPVAVNDSGAVTFNTALVVGAPGVLANDSGTGISVTAHTAPAHGVVSIAPGGGYTYTPTTNYAGSDVFSYTITDSASQTSSATVNLTVAPPPAPAAVNDSGTTSSTIPLVVVAPGVLANDSGTGLSVTAHTAPAHGNLVISSSGGYTYTPNAGYSGPDSFTYTDSDVVGRTTTATVNLTVLAAGPPGPVIIGISPPSGPPPGGETVIIGGLNLCGATSATFGSAAATILSISADCTTIRVTEPPGHGTVSVKVTTPYGSATSPVPFTYIEPGYWEAASDGGVFSFGGARFFGSVPGVLKPGQRLNSPIVAMADTPDHGGYWLFAADGGVFAFGDATFYGSVPGVLIPQGRTLNGPVVAAEATPDGGGYREFAADGGVFDFGDAVFTGSLPLYHVIPSQPIGGAISTPIGQGYWLVAGDGGVFAFGNAVFEGSAVGHTVSKVVSMATTPDGLGYWIFGAGGDVVTEGDALRGLGGIATPNAPIVFGQSTSTGLGYWQFGADGGVFTHGDAPFEGSLGGLHLNAPITAGIAFGSTTPVPGG